MHAELDMLDAEPEDPDYAPSKHKRKQCEWEPYRCKKELMWRAPKDTEHLVIDGEYMGNVSRFFNHSCEGNVVCQTVLLPGAGSALLYCYAVFAQTTVPAMTELRWDYNISMPGEAQEGSVPCLCGSSRCRKWLY